MSTSNQKDIVNNHGIRQANFSGEDKKTLNFAIGQRVKELRNKKGLNQSEFSDLCGGVFKRSMISMLENGESYWTASYLLAAAYALDVDVRELLGIEFDKDQMMSGEEIMFLNAYRTGGPKSVAMLAISLLDNQPNRK